MLGIMAAMDESELATVPSGVADGDRLEPPVAGPWIGLRGRLAQPFWGWIGAWAVLCGALASNSLRWEAEALLALALTLLLAELAWGSLWDLAVGTAWFRPLAEGWPPSRAAPAAALPYTQPGSPGGRLALRLGRLAAWWRASFWPAAGPALLGLLAALILTAVLALLLPNRLRPLYAALAALGGLGVVQRRRGRDPLAAQALVRVGLSWLAGHAALSEVGVASVVLGLAFSLAAWGLLRLGAGLGRGLWLLNGGQIVEVAVLVGVRQPVAAGVAGLLLFGQVAMQPALLYGGGLAHQTISRRSWPWLVAAMLVAAWALP
ncbi:MAG: hypothetical protein P8189_09725 [Anaerolineae bacterium]